MREITEEQKKEIITNYNYLSDYQRKVLYSLYLVLKDKSKEIESAVTYIYDYEVRVTQEELQEIYSLVNKPLMFDIGNINSCINWLEGYDCITMEKSKIARNFKISDKVKWILSNAVFDENKKIIDLNI
ncbi:hypothetical protein I5677_09245 [Mobilitalea sibirica]|uniref:Uncharacterized protein n=1 Tax=Mobilitalea sibirica TaxID=1462919 RepID=A0A8J7HDR3_9FIRM|nr:hypothetical protein [Mobilitalea sibirica]MBH1941074.1 hypothetical protein [Mobilitalea sibirica]